MSSNFFEEQKEQSLVKSTIVSKYFDAWASVIISTQKKHPRHSQKISYIDLFAGPGRYKDGTKSTPVMILQKAINNNELRERLVAIFNDKDENNSHDLQNTINEIPGIETLKFKPIVYNQEVGVEIVKLFENNRLVPTLFFVDPWGYKGLSLRLINSVLKDWGCDAIFFFNYNRINMGLSNGAVMEHMTALFGEEEFKMLRKKLADKDTYVRELLIIEELCQSLKKYDTRYVLPFRFKNKNGKRTSHHLIFASKHFRGYEIMKDIMARESTSSIQDVPSFEYNPADFLPQQTLLFQLDRPLENLRQDLLDKFKGQRITMIKLYETHSVDTPFIKKNYKDVLRQLFDDGIISAVSPVGKPPRRGSFGDNLIVTFPS